MMKNRTKLTEVQQQYKTRLSGYIASWTQNLNLGIVYSSSLFYLCTSRQKSTQKAAVYTAVQMV